MLIRRSNKPSLRWTSITGANLEGTFAFICWQQMNLLFQASAERSEVFPQEGRLLPGGELGMGAVVVGGSKGCDAGRYGAGISALTQPCSAASIWRGAIRQGQDFFALNASLFLACTCGISAGSVPGKLCPGSAPRVGSFTDRSAWPWCRNLEPPGAAPSESIAASCCSPCCVCLLADVCPGRGCGHQLHRGSCRGAAARPGLAARPRAGPKGEAVPAPHPSPRPGTLLPLTSCLPPPGAGPVGEALRHHSRHGLGDLQLTVRHPGVGGSSTA